MNFACHTQGLETQLWPDAQAAQGRADFRELLRRHERDVRRTARRLCLGNEDRAQDLAQDAFVRAYEACLNGRFQADGNGRAWLLRILTNLAINDFSPPTPGTSQPGRRHPDIGGSMPAATTDPVA